MKKIKFWSLYTVIILFIQMIFIVIYNIPIYKIYCELNSYYSLNISNFFFDNKIILFNSDNYISFNNINFSNFFIYNKLFSLDYLILNNFLYSLNLNFFFFF